MKRHLAQKPQRSEFDEFASPSYSGLVHDNYSLHVFCLTISLYTRVDGRRYQVLYGTYSLICGLPFGGVNTIRHRCLHLPVNRTTNYSVSSKELTRKPPRQEERLLCIIRDEGILSSLVSQLCCSRRVN